MTDNGMNLHEIPTEALERELRRRGRIVPARPTGRPKKTAYCPKCGAAVLGSLAARAHCTGKGASE